MKDIKIVESPTTIHGRTLDFGGVYGTIDGFTYYVDWYHEGINRKGILNFWVWSDTYNMWMRTSSALHKKYKNLAHTVCTYIIKNRLYMHQPTPYIRNKDIATAGPKEKKAQNELIFKVPNVGYAISGRVTTDTDPMRRIRAGVSYYPA